MENEEWRRHAQAGLDLAMRPGERNRTGQFATPGPLAEEILRYCWEYWRNHPRPVQFLEPCVGTGSFYSALRRVFPHEVIEHATGYEIDSRHADTARRLWHNSGLAVTRGDFLQQSPPRKKYNLLVTNPPYVRHHHMDRGQKERLQGLVRNRLGIKISGLAGLYCYFLLLADVWLEEGGLSVWLIPSEFMDVNYGTAVKQYLTKKVKLLRIHRFCPSDVQFDDALVSSAVVVFEKGPPGDHQVVFSFGGSPLLPGKTVSLHPRTLRPSEKWTPHTAASGLPGRRPARGILFGDLFTIRRGLATGSNSFFILPRAEAERLKLPANFLRPILPPPRRLPQSVIEANPDGFPRLEPQLVLLDCRLPETEVKNQYSGLWRYLEAGRKKRIHEGYLTSRRTPWYSQEYRPPPYLCTYMGRSGNGRTPFRFLWNKSNATAHNVYLLLYPRGVLEEALKQDPGLQAGVFAALETLDTESILNDGRVYGGGLYKMEPKELANIPADFIAKSLGLRQHVSVSQQRHLFESLEEGEYLPA